MKANIVVNVVGITCGLLFVSSCSKESKRSRLLHQADAYFEGGNYDKAKVTYLNVIQLDPQNTLAFQRIGAMWQDDSDPLRAAPFLKRAGELDPNSVENHLRLARCYVAMGGSAQAKDEVMAVLQKIPDNSDAIVVLADAARNKEDMEAAAQELEKYPRKDHVSFHLASANLFLKNGNLIGATNAVQQALSIDPKSSAAHMAMGDLYLLRKDAEKAAEEFKKAADLAPIRSTERLKYAAFESATGGIEETRRVAIEMTKQAPDYLPGWVLLAEVASKEQKDDEALSLLENIFSRDPDYLDGRRVQSDLLLAKGETKKAVEILARLDQNYPGVALIKHQLARAYVKANNLNQAKLTLEEAISANPNYADAVMLLAEVNLRTGHPDLVIKPLTDLLQRIPEMRQAAVLLATAYRSLSRFDEAVAVLEEQIQRTPQDPQLQALLGVTLRQAKRYDQAYRAFEKAAQLAPDDLTVLNQLVELDLLAKNYEAARQIVRDRFDKKSDAPAAHFWEGKILAAQGSWEAAQVEAQRTLQLDPDFSGAYDLLVQTYLASNKLPQAISQIQIVLSRYPKNVSAMMTLALLYERTNDYQRERDVYEKLLVLEPNSVPALNNLACLYAEQLNDLQKAQELARKAHYLEPENPAAADTLGWVLYKRGEYQQALPILQESADKAPENPEIQFHLGMTNYMMGKTDEAKVAMRKAATVADDFPGKEESKRRLAVLENGTDGSPKLSIAQLEELRKAYPNDVISQMQLGDAYEQAREPEKAAAVFEQVLKINPKLPGAAVKLAELYAGPVLNKEKAFRYAEKARELAPGDPQVTALLGKVAYQTGNFSWSYSLLQEATRERPKDPATLHAFGWAAYTLGKINEARELMQRVIAAGAKSTQATDAEKFLMLTAFDQDPKQLLAAENKVQKELASNPDYVPALMAEAALEAQRGHSAKAIDIYTEILRRFPDMAPAQKHLATLYAQDQSTMAAAYEIALKARKAFPDDPELSRLLGRLSYEKKEYPRAVQLLQESARKQTLDADSLFYLGMSQLQARQTIEGRGVLNKALTNGLEEPFATEAKRALANFGRN